MRRRLTLGPKYIGVIATVLFLGFSLLFSGCGDEPGDFDDFLKCDCQAPPQPPDPGFFWQFQYLDCDGPPIAHVASVYRDQYFLDTPRGKVSIPPTIAHCSRPIRYTRAACQDNNPRCQ